MGTKKFISVLTQEHFEIKIFKIQPYWEHFELKKKAFNFSEHF